MKRSPMPVRRTPLRPGRPLESRTPLQRSCPIKRVSDRRKRENRQRTVIVNWLRKAQEGRCARCGAAGVQLDGHELRGGSYRHRSILDPQCALCRRCNGWAEDHPQVAAYTGWKVSGKWAHDPALALGEAWDLDGNRVVFADLAAEVTL